MINFIKKIAYKLITRHAVKVSSPGFYSQYGQDRFIAETLFKNKQKGIFIEVGANDGITFSNTLYFEETLSWSGICIEPNPTPYEKLTKNRHCETAQACIAEYNGELEFLAIDGYSEMLSGVVDKYHDLHSKRIDQELKEHGGKKETVMVKCLTLESIVKESTFTEIDYLSIDTEGGELDILKSINLDKLKINVISVENNYQSLEFLNILRDANYKLVALAGSDEIYQKLD